MGYLKMDKLYWKSPWLLTKNVVYFSIIKKDNKMSKIFENSQIIDGIEVIAYGTVEEVLFPGVDWPDWDESCKKLKKWNAENDSTYYAECREDFFIRNAVEKAKIEGKSRVVVDDLS